MYRPICVSGFIPWWLHNPNAIQYSTCVLNHQHSVISIGGKIIFGHHMKRLCHQQIICVALILIWIKGLLWFF
jgi:hypothetical protein